MKMQVCTSACRIQHAVNERVNTLSYLIAKCDWKKVYLRLQTSPEDASIPVPTSTRFEGTVYPLHQAILREDSPVPREVILLFIKLFPIALDYNTFIGACENPQLSCDSLRVLLDSSSDGVYQAIKRDAQYFARIALNRKNKNVLKLFMNRFPNMLRGDFLSYICTHGTAEMVDEAITAGLRNDISNAGGLFFKNHNKEDTLDIAIRLYDDKDVERRNILVTCVMHANAFKMGLKVQDNYPVILAATNFVPQRVLRSLLNLYGYEISKINEGGKNAMLKAIKMSFDDGCDNELPPIFESSILIKACSDGNARLVEQLFENTFSTSTEISFEKDLGIVNQKNALEVALDLFDESNKASCQILKCCIQYANVAKLGMTNLPSSYPTLLAAVGIVPPNYLLDIGKIYKDELNMLDYTGKLALQKVAKMAQKKGVFAKRLDIRAQYPLSIDVCRKLLGNSLSSISEDDIKEEC